LAQIISLFTPLYGLNHRQTNIRCSIINENNEIIGLVSLTNINRINQSAIFHIMIGDSNSRGKGAGYYATNEMLRHAFLDMNLNRVELTVLTSNKKAIKLYEKVGFKYEGTKREAIYKEGKFVDMDVMAALKNEFLMR
jgi:RimJ/RimL family protein N-acetyltransferase